MSEIRNKKTGEHTSWDVAYLCESLGDKLLAVLLPIHAMSGCDTTGAFFGHGKRETLGLAQSNPAFYECLLAFTNTDVSLEELDKAGRYMVGCLYEKPNGETTYDEVKAGTTKQVDLDAMRLRILRKKDAHKGEEIDYRIIPPTADSARHHGLRVRLQVADWLDQAGLNPVEYGWMLKDHPLHPSGPDNPKAYFPRWTIKSALPEGLAQIIKCGCSATKCEKAQHCRCLRAKQPCTDLCGKCKGATCNNRPPAPDQAEQETADA